MFLVSLYAVAITIGLCLYWLLHSSSIKKSSLQAAFSSENSKDPPEDNGSCSSGMHYFKSHKSPRKVQLKEVHHSNETASVKVMTPDGVTLVQAHELRPREDKVPPPPHKRRPAPPPPPKQPPKRPPPPPPPVTPPPQVVVVANDGETEDVEHKSEGLRHDAKNQLQCVSSPQLCSSASSAPWCLASPPPPPPQDKGTKRANSSEEPLPQPPDVDVQSRVLDSSSLIYPKNSYMSYRSEKKIGRQGFDGKYRRSFHTSSSSVDLTTLGSSFQEGKDANSPNSWEQTHNIRQHGTTVVFHSGCLQSDNSVQRTNSQDCVNAEELKPKETADISSSDSQQSQSNHSSTSITDSQGNQTQSVPYTPASHENNSWENRDPHPNDTKATSPQNSDNESNCETAPEDFSALDNGLLTDESFVENESDTSSLTSVDHNQNAIKNSVGTVNGRDLNRINCATQTNDTSKFHKKYTKTKEELECEQLSVEYINQCTDTSIKNLLIPSSNHRTISDYMEGLLNLELESTRQQVQRSRCTNNPPNNENRQKEEKCASNDKTQLNSNGTSNNSEVNDNQNNVDDEEQKKRKEQLIQSIQKKVKSFRHEQSHIKDEMIQNELVGREIASRLEKVAKPNELEKYSLHVEEMEKIVNLLLSLSGRLARAENILRNIPKEATTEEKKILEAKREKLKEQHEDARRLKESIDRRSNQVSTFLHRYLTEDEYAEYDRFIKMKIKLIVDIREIDEKINLGEEQLAALTVEAHVWKSANS